MEVGLSAAGLPFFAWLPFRSESITPQPGQFFTVDNAIGPVLANPRSSRVDNAPDPCYNGFKPNCHQPPAKMKVFLDDVRPTPVGWVRCYWPDEVIKLLKTGKVEVVSLDHDLGDDTKGTGMDVCKWIEQTVYENGFDGGFIPPAVLIHSANPVGMRNMDLAIRFFSHHFKTTAGAMDPSAWETYLERVRQYG